MQHVKIEAMNANTVFLVVVPFVLVTVCDILDKDAGDDTPDKVLVVITDR